MSKLHSMLDYPIDIYLHEDGHQNLRQELYLHCALSVLGITSTQMVVDHGFIDWRYQQLMYWDRERNQFNSKDYMRIQRAYDYLKNINYVGNDMTFFS